ncbi:hypothetical protein [Allobranchiibius huperziae]|uniref:DUF8175 domain-containing protein n=1 Tax=Allobranchiibius huperziae TaxID=1874116 RepID=A0A853DIL1_9MICO|nr:hypothetical protein [Allobranchiibius huperziae]NYJ76537.1 hypothetical protein [Allobranchiibius huperziae]
MARDDNNENDDTAGGGIASSPVWWAAGGVIVLVIAGLLWILLSRGGSGSTATPTRTVTASPTVSTTGTGSLSGTSTATSSTASGVGGCNVPGGNGLVPTSAIPATWQTVGAVAVPVSSTAGPKTITGPEGSLRSCYQHSPTGAVIAAMNIALASSSSNGHAVIEQGYTPGPGKTEAEQLPADPSNAAIAGFKTEACTQSSCLVRIAITVQGQNIEGTMPMVWSGGDWKVNGQVTGVAQAVVITSLATYVPMSPSAGGGTS